MGLIFLSLHGHSAQKTYCRLFFVWRSEEGLVLAQLVIFHWELSMVTLNGALMKNGPGVPV